MYPIHLRCVSDTVYFAMKKRGSIFLKRYHMV
nr:MAG TPA: hypothetical protein [Caudoviricetes sp.]